MSDVPSELVLEILVRLPAESLLRFRSVCKEWLRIIDDPSFIKAHTNIQFWSHTLLVKSHSGRPLYSLCLDSFNFITNGSLMIDVTRIENLLAHAAPLSFVASCNGLILTSNTEDFRDISVILNPLTRECHYLPKPNAASSKYGHVIQFGFGYDSDSDDYKVVRIYNKAYQTLIYSLKSDSWRMVEDSPCGRMNRNATFLNGSLYWLSWDSEAIIALNLGTERYCQLPLPLPLPRVTNGFGLDAMDGCLISSVEDREKKTFDGWVMKDGVEKSWIKVFSLEVSIFLTPVIFRFAAYLKRKEQVVLRHRDGFLWFDIRNNSIKKCSISGLHITSCLICPGSLVRLRDYRGSHTGFGDVTTKRTLPLLEKMKMKMKMICDDL